MHATVPLTEDATVRHIIDPKQSNFVIQVFATGLLSAFGHDPRIAVRDFYGNVDFTPGAGSLAGARLSLGIHAESLEVLDDISEKDRREIDRRIRQEVLETDQFPAITYECPRVTGSGSGDRYWAALNGDLTLHGVTRSMPVSARVTVNGDSLRAAGEFTLRQSDYRIAPVSAAAGTIRVKDEVKCTFDIVAHKQA
ncbi:MAG TPA: YceI family protein [Candidatus Sulfotelmatobacter sp.]|nr:YceI family protein [Candidatus Sulfotelmatobacter sp.]